MVYEKGAKGGAKRGWRASKSLEKSVLGLDARDDNLLSNHILLQHTTPPNMFINGLGYTPPAGEKPVGASAESSSKGEGEGETIRVQVEFG